MLAAIISLLQDQPAVQKPKPPTVHVDRGGGGGARYPAAEIEDYLTAVKTFREVPGESPVARAVRRTEHITRELLRLREARENEQKAMAAGVLWGAYLERSAAVDSAQDKATAAATLPATAIDRHPAPPSRVPEHQRGQYADGSSTVAIALGIGIGFALVVLARRRQ